MLVLHQFAASHYNEKVRWALTFKGLAHDRSTYLPGPHAAAIRRRSGGSTSTPVLEHDGGHVSGSAAIIDWLESRHPTPSLYPADPAERAQALALQQRWDAEIGPAVRTAVFAVFIDEPAYLCATFAATKPLLTRLAYRAVLPLASPRIRAANDVYPDRIAAAEDMVTAALDEVVTTAAANGHLVGSSFSIADLTGASLLAPLADVEHPDMRRERPMPRSVERLLDRWRGHPAIDWVHRTYARHRDG